jgi:hypothetical protein
MFSRQPAFWSNFATESASLRFSAHLGVSGPAVTFTSEPLFHSIGVTSAQRDRAAESLAIRSGAHPRLANGDIFHGALTLDQLFSARPMLEYADYRMPVLGLYLCGSGAHPGGGVTGAPGHNAAQTVIADLIEK